MKFRLTHTQEYRIVAAFAALMRLLPRPLALSAGAAVGQIGWLSRIRRKVVDANLRQALPDLPARERRRLGARAARNFGRTAVEFLRFAGSDRERLEDLVTITGLDELHAARRDGRGIVLVTGHLGAWALYVTALANADVPTALLVGRQHNPKVDGFIHDIPGEAVTFIGKGKSAPRNIVRALKDGKTVVMVADHYGGRRGTLAPFLGRPASTLSLPGSFVARYQAPLFLMTGHRIEGGRHDLRLRRLAVPSSSDEDELKTEIATVCNQAIGEAVLEHPDQYFWYHRRWKEQGDKNPDALTY